MPTSSHPSDIVRGPAVAVEVVHDGIPVRFARLQAVRADVVKEVRTDAGGRALLTDLVPGRWSLVARDSRRTTCSAAASVVVAATGTTTATLSLVTATGGLLVELPDLAGTAASRVAVSVTDREGHRVIGTALGGLAHLRGLRPGRHTVVVGASLGRLGTIVHGVDVAAGALVACSAARPLGGVLSGRVIQGGAIQYAAVVALLDDTGTELERTRTDLDGRFVLGLGLPSSRGLTVAASSGPQTLHVTTAAVADVAVVSGTARDLGDLHLPVTGPGAVWASRRRAASGMRLPSTHV